MKTKFNKTGIAVGILVITEVGCKIVGCTTSRISAILPSKHSSSSYWSAPVCVYFTVPE